MFFSFFDELFSPKTGKLPKNYNYFGKSDKLVVDADHFIELYKGNRSAIKNSKIVLPELNNNDDFGKFVIDLNPIANTDLELIDE